MRVLHVYSGNLFGGVETLLVTLARDRALNPSMEPHFALAFEGRLSEDLRQAGAPVHALGGVRLSRPLSVWAARRKLAALLRTEPFDCVICHSPWPHAIFAPVVRAFRRPLGFWLHQALVDQHWSERWARLTPPDFAVCASEFTRETLPNLYPGVPGVVIYCPVDPSTRSWTDAERASARSGLDSPDDMVAIIQPGRMEEFKGHLLHLEALGLLKDLPHWVCWIIGAPQRAFMKAVIIEDSRSTRASWESRIASALEVGCTARRCSCYWLPLKSIASPTLDRRLSESPFLEAMAAGLPVITTAIGGAKEIVNEACGILTPPANPQALAKGLRQLISPIPISARDSVSQGQRASKSFAIPKRR